MLVADLGGLFRCRGEEGEIFPREGRRPG